jgi:deoxyhypusine synthase
MEIRSGMNVCELAEEMKWCGFGARRLAMAVEIYEEMLREDCTRFFALAGAMVPAGQRNIISDIIKRGYIDVLVTTGANLVHDVIECFGHHTIGGPLVDDWSLRREGLSRVYDVYISDSQFELFEELLQSILPDKEEIMTGSDLLSLLGSKLSDNNSILRSAYECNVPIFCPALSDSMIGLQAWLHRQTKRLSVDEFGDLSLMVDICYSAKRSGIMIIGGGVPKNFALQSMLVTPNSFDLAIQLTMDRPETGGLSGATLSEAISWGKINPNARHVTVYGDATINFPLIVAATLSNLDTEQSKKYIN